MSQYFEKVKVGEEKQTATGTDAQEIALATSLPFSVFLASIFLFRKNVFVKKISKSFSSVNHLISVIKQCH